MKKISLLLLAFLCLTCGAIKAQYGVLYNFNGTQGAFPVGSLTLSGAKFYGMTNGGGAYDSGTIFSIDTNGTNYKDLHDFGGIYGAYPQSGTLKISGNKMYGMTDAGGAHDSGCVFSMDTTGAAYKVLLSFTGANGAEPLGSLTLVGKKLFGTTYTGGTHKKGNVFTIDTTGKNYKDLQNLTGAATNGINPPSDVIVIKDKIFGTTEGGTAYGNIFSLDSNGTNFKDIYNFDAATGAIGAFPNSLTWSGTQFFGMTQEGGANYLGNIYSIDTLGTLDSKDLLEFQGTGYSPSGEYPLGSVVLSGKVLYGMTFEGGQDSTGTLFSVDTDGTNYIEFHDFDSATYGSGNTPYDNVTPVGKALYGMAAYGGTTGVGVIFRFNLPLPIGVTTTVTAVSCNGGDNGTATAIVTGGIAPFTYLWTDLNSQTTDTATGLSAGTYTVSVNDSYGDAGTAIAIITQPTLLSATANTTTNATCNTTGSASSTVTGGTSPYTYSWSPSGGNGANGTGLTAGTYTLTVTDNNGCTSTATTAVTEPPVLTATATTLSNVTCVTLGYISASATGGTSPYTYSWTGGAGTNSVASQLSAGTYTVTVTDHSGCTSTSSTVVSQTASLSATANTSTNVSCNGGDNATVSSTVTGGTSPYTYAWTGGAGTNATASGLAAGTYTLSVTDNAGCTSSATTVVTQPNILSASANTTSNVSCNTTGGVSSTVTGGTSPYTYSWSPAGGNNATATGLSAGTYTLNVTDKNGCTSSATTVITQPANSLNVTATTTASVTCYDGNNGSVLATVSGGVSPYTYVWSGGGSQTTAAVSGLSAGTYTVGVTDNAGCLSSSTTIISQPAILSASASTTTNATCNGGDNGSASASASGGTAPYTYAWSTTPLQLGATATGLSAGTYTVGVRDGCSFETTATVVITQPTAVTISANTITNAACSGNNGSASASASGGTTPYTYAWSTNPTQYGNTATGLSAGTYTVGVMDHNGCTNTASVVITQSSSLSVSANATNNVTCNGNNDGSALATVSGGTAPYTYAWSTTPTQFSATATGLSAGTYVVGVIDNNGCNNTASVVITAPTVLTTTVTGITNPLCNGLSGSATAVPSGGSAPYTYAWSPAGGNGATANGVTAGSYTVTVSDNNGCTSTASVVLTQPAGISTSINSTDANGTNNGTATISASGGTAPYTYIWSPGGQTTTTATGLSAGSYCCAISDNNGCTQTSCVTVNFTAAGINSISSASAQIHVYPNPSTGNFTIQTSGSAQTVNVFNMLGQQVLSKELTGQTNELNLSSQPDGVYLYRVISDNGNLIGDGKLIIQK